MAFAMIFGRGVSMKVGAKEAYIKQLRDQGLNHADDYPQLSRNLGARGERLGFASENNFRSVLTVTLIGTLAFKIYIIAAPVVCIFTPAVF